MKFKLASDYEPRGDQPEAISQLVRGLTDGDRHQVLLGVTGSGKTFTVAKVIEQLNRPSIVLAPVSYTHLCCAIGPSYIRKGRC